MAKGRWLLVPTSGSAGAVPVSGGCCCRGLSLFRLRTARPGSVGGGRDQRAGLQASVYRGQEVHDGAVMGIPLAG